MRSWLETLTDDDLAGLTDIGDGDRFPLWSYRVHIVTHGEQCQRDARIVLANLGHEPPDLEFLVFRGLIGQGRRAGT